ncbi:MAG: ankyrin repeat domain-containing protein [Acidobacteria bacterium]|nr:ankyrin repeat domain-containing protein [Acidobacteriota bacterium]
MSLFWLRLDQICVQSVLAQNQTLTRLSIALGADVNGRDSYGGFPLLFATVRNNRSLVEYLVASGADPYQNAEGQTLLDYACQICSVDLVDYYQSLGVSRTKMLVPSDCPICESEADP